MEPAEESTTPRSLGAGPIEVRRADGTDRLSWNGYVDAHPEGTPYHLYEWTEAVERAYGHRGRLLLAERGSEVVGLLPLVLMRSPLGRALVSLPFCDLGDVLSDNEETREDLLEEALRMGRELGASRVELRGGKGEAGPKVRMVLQLPGDSQALWAGLPSKLRSQVRKAEKNGLSFRWGSVEDVDAFYRVFSRNMRDLGSPVHSKAWVAEILKGYGDCCRLALVFHEEAPIAGGIVLYTRRAIAIPWASTLREFNRLAPNMLLYWKLLEFAADKGFESFDFGRSTVGEGTYRFKEQWGAKPVPLRWQILGEGRARDPDLSRSRKREWAAAAWSRLPVGVANWLGPRLRRYISL